MPAGRGRRFPVGIYATLLAALCWLAVPQLTLPLEAWLLGVTCLPLRAYASWSGDRARLAEPAPQDWARVRGLLERQGQVAAEMPAAAGREPVICRVLQWSTPGGGGLPAELTLDRTYRELEGCSRFVTVGDRLLGFLARPGEGLEEEEEEDDHDLARVLLLNHPLSEAVPACLETDPDQVLRCVVEPAGSVDRWPLRCRLWENPYAASLVTESGGELRTWGLEGAEVPGGLLLGSSQVWGYRVGDETIPIGVFVQPAMDPRAISTVVLWRRESGVEFEGLRMPLTGGSLEPVSLSRVHAPRGERWFVHGRWSRSFPDGAALVRGLHLLGIVRGMGPGQGRLERFEGSRRSWSLILLPEAGEPLELRGQVVAEESGGVRIELAGDEVGQFGYLFTGANNLHCPAGLLVGEVLQVAGDGQVLVSRQPGPPDSGQGVYIFGGGER